MNDTNSLGPSSRVWIYHSNRPLTKEECTRVSMETAAFARKWTAHNQQLMAWGGVVEDRFVVLMVDESRTGASGCSIDSSVHFIQSLEQKFGLELFNRMLLTYKDEIGLHTITLSELHDALDDGKLSMDTIVANPLVATKQEFDAGFFAPLKDTWVANMV
ncbi:MAG: hypothetical protein H6548_11220 [Chitinophagales bacterium]|nr:hypothetical protein [Chitinophagales bacterium]MCB9022678.1 hypothetical protein [Chitinophagales bacterium]HPR28270.1 hypothetical protein [Chitinophagales bacterium]HQU40082.1 hypothetical protein [Chitinophagales bacterium]